MEKTTMNAFQNYSDWVNEKTAVNPHNSILIANIPIYNGVILEPYVDFANKTVGKSIKGHEHYIFENNNYKNIKKLPKTHPVIRGLQTLRTIQGF
jgi:hypothetical protein